MRIGVYAGSLRPGGGITALRQVLDGLLARENVEITVFTGAEDCSQAIRDLVEQHPQLKEERFYPQARSFARYLRSKWAFRKRGGEFDWMFSVNYHLPAPCKVAVYHLNMLSFEKGPGDGWGAAFKRFDARYACKHAEVNLFESRVLLDVAKLSTGGKIHSADLLYLGIHPQFYASPTHSVDLKPAQLLMVSSMGAHKDNSTALRTLAKLVRERPDTDWRLKIAGGQSIAQWQPLLDQAAELGVAERIEVLGPLDRSALSREMGASLCLINPSRIESFCMVALEAMASFCPSIVTSETSMPESVGDAAMVVKAGDEDAFANAVLRYSEDSELRADYLARGRRRAEQFSPQEFRRRLGEVLPE
ncbi:MAG: glycosyltransferase [Planctomycetes bacterium]|nr:glycosyltransferase [Planctomycetota bacterium]